VRHASLLVAAVLLSTSAGADQSMVQRCPTSARVGDRCLLDGVLNERIQFVTFAPPDRFLRFVAVTGPPDLLALSRVGDVAVLDALVLLLRDRGRAWAANVLLTAMTRDRFEGRDCDTYATNPAGWLRYFFPSAHRRWSDFLRGQRARLVWNEGTTSFDLKPR
jgi:hypothetical protein